MHSFPARRFAFLCAILFFVFPLFVLRPLTQQVDSISALDSGERPLAQTGASDLRRPSAWASAPLDIAVNPH